MRSRWRMLGATACLTREHAMLKEPGAHLLQVKAGLLLYPTRSARSSTEADAPITARGPCHLGSFGVRVWPTRRGENRARQSTPITHSPETRASRPDEVFLYNLSMPTHLSAAVSRTRSVWVVRGSIEAWQPSLFATIPGLFHGITRHLAEGAHGIRGLDP